MKIKIKAKDNVIYSGKEIADYITKITEDSIRIPDEFILDEYVKENRWQLKTISINEVLKDSNFKETWLMNKKNLRYDNDYHKLNYSEYNQPIVLYQDENETLLIDGYSRTQRHLYDKDQTIKAYVNIKE
jgi:hypothetical protein